MDYPEEIGSIVSKHLKMLFFSDWIVLSSERDGACWKVMVEGHVCPDEYGRGLGAQDMASLRSFMEPPLRVILMATSKCVISYDVIDPHTIASP